MLKTMYITKSNNRQIGHIMRKPVLFSGIFKHLITQPNLWYMYIEEGYILATGSEQQRLKSDCLDAKSDLFLRCLHKA